MDFGRKIFAYCTREEKVTFAVTLNSYILWLRAGLSIVALHRDCTTGISLNRCWKGVVINM